MAVSLSEAIGIAKKMSQQQVSIGITNVEFVSPNVLKFTLADTSIYNITIPELHTHSNLSNILEKFTVDAYGKLLFNGQPIEGGIVDLSNYYNKSEVDNLVNNKTDIDDAIVSLAKTYSSSKIDTTYVKKEIGKSLFSGSYNDLTDKPQLGFTDLSTFTTDDLTESASKKYVYPTQITNWDNHIGNKTNIHEVKLSDLMDTNITTPTGSQVLGYDIVTSKWKNLEVSVTDEKVKLLPSSPSSQYISDIIDGTTIKLNSTNDKIEVVKIKDQLSTVNELNFLVGLDKNVKSFMDSLVGGVHFKSVLNTKAELLAITAPEVGDLYIVRADESVFGSPRKGYIYSSTNVWEMLDEPSERDFSVNKIVLTNGQEVTGILPISMVDTTTLALKSDLDSYPKTIDLETNYSKKTDLVGKINTTDVIDNLTSIDIDKPLSANQGRVLKGLVDGKPSINDVAIASTTDTYSIDKINNTYVEKVVGKQLSTEDYTTAEKTKLSNITGTNTGDETQATIKTKLGEATTTNDGYLSSIDWNTFNNKADKLNTMPQTSYGSTSTNLNTILTTGIYYCSAWTNYPTQYCADGQGTAIVYKYVTGWEKQIFITPHENAMYTRVRVNSTWSEWERFITNKNVSNPNLLINGDFQVWQRGTSFLNASTYGTYTADRWRIDVNNGSVASVEKVNNALKFTMNTNSSFSPLLVQEIEIPQYIKGRQVTLSGQFGTVSGEFRMVLQHYTASVHTPISSEIIATNGYYKVTATIPANVDRLYAIVASTSNTTSGSYCLVYNLKLELGTIATNYMPRLYAEELALCKRYYQVLDASKITGQFFATTHCRLSANIFPEMRNAPSYTLPSAGNATVESIGTGNKTGGTCGTPSTNNGRMIHFDVVGLSPALQFQQAVATFSIPLDAEIR